MKKNFKKNWKYFFNSKKGFIFGVWETNYHVKTNKMTFQKLFLEAQVKFINGYSQSRLVDFVFTNANNDTQANKILNKILK